MVRGGARKEVLMSSWDTLLASPRPLGSLRGPKTLPQVEALS